MEGTATLESAINTARGMECSVNDRYGIIAFSHLRWRFVWQRPQQLLSRLATHHTVLFIEDPIYDLSAEEPPRLALDYPATRICVACPHFPANVEARPGDLQGLLLSALSGLDDECFANPLLWYYTPTMADWSMNLLDARGVVYDCMDELSQFRFAPEGLADRERRLIERADIVFTGGFELWQKKREHHGNVHFFGCGVEYEHFARARKAELAVPADIDGLPHPVIGWFGVIDERFDLDLLQRMAELRTNWSFVMVGPIVKIDEAILPRSGNIHWLGQRDYASLPGYCKGFDICMMWFALNEATEFINPTKALEYLATGRPVFATPVRDVVRQYSDVINISGTASQLIDGMERALLHPDDGQIERGIELAKRSRWEATVSEMERLISLALASRGKRTARAGS